MQLSLKDLVKYCDAELELPKSHLKETQELYDLLYSKFPSNLRENVFEKFSLWIVAMPCGKKVLSKSWSNNWMNLRNIHSVSNQVIRQSSIYQTNPILPLRNGSWTIDHQFLEYLVDHTSFRLGSIKSDIEIINLYK